MYLLIRAKYICAKSSPMRNPDPIKTYTLAEMVNKHIGKRGTPRREAFEDELQRELMSEVKRASQLKRNRSQTGGLGSK